MCDKEYKCERIHKPIHQHTYKHPLICLRAHT